jgi:glutamine synthetase
VPRPAASPVTGAEPVTRDVYGLRRLDEHAAFLRELWAACDGLRVPLEGAIAEYSPAQLELVLRHRPDALAAADDAVTYKRLVKGLATRHGLDATFMAKPWTERIGSGLHLHVSVNDAEGRNIFASDDPAGTPLLRHALGGLKALLPESVAIFAPNANSFRRFQPHSYAPMTANWAINNRTAALRIPAGPPQSRHIEHRVAGADANPYLALAALLAGVHHGLTQKRDPGPPVEGNGYGAQNAGPPLPHHWHAALDLFEGSSILGDYLGDAAFSAYATIKRAEQARFFETVTQLDYDWCLYTA